MKRPQQILNLKILRLLGTNVSHIPHLSPVELDSLAQSNLKRLDLDFDCFLNKSCREEDQSTLLQIVKHSTQLGRVFEPYDAIIWTGIDAVEC